MTDRTNIYFDFEFIDDGRDIVPISVGMCTSAYAQYFGKGKTPPEELYIEYGFDPARASDWVRENVFPHLDYPEKAGWGTLRRQADCQITEWVAKVCGDTKPQFIGFYPSYDWVCLCQHFGTMMQLPKGWPRRPMCLMQLADHLGITNKAFPKKPENAHHALADAKWNRSLHEYLQDRDD